MYLGTGSTNGRNQAKAHEEGGAVNLRRHQAQCTICRSPFREAIDESFLNWISPPRIVDKYPDLNLSKDIIYRHVRACGLIDKRRENSMGALEVIVERTREIIPVLPAASYVSAVIAYAKLNNSNTQANPPQSTDLRELLGRMSQEEREAFALDGSLPDWILGKKAATPHDIPEAELDENKGFPQEKAATVSGPQPEDSSVRSMASGAVEAGSTVASQEHAPGVAEPEELEPSAAPAERLWTPAVEPVADPVPATQEPLNISADLPGGSPPCPPATMEGV
jgi:hypothetical protein